MSTSTPSGAAGDDFGRFVMCARGVYRQTEHFDAEWRNHLVEHALRGVIVSDHACKRLPMLLQELYNLHRLREEMRGSWR